LNSVIEKDFSVPHVPGIPEQLSRSQKVLSGSEESRQKVRQECKKVSFGIRSWLAAEPLNRVMFIFISFFARLVIFSVHYIRHSTERSLAAFVL
jgi:hypothetical protein